MLTAVTLRHFVAAVLVFTALPQVCLGKGQQEGRVNMTGSIFENTCSIDTPSQYQDVLMNLVPVGEILRDGTGASTSLSIRLVGCPPEDRGGHVWATFYGDSDTDNHFQLSGYAEGVSLRMADAAGTEVRPGVPMPLVVGRTKKEILDYTLTLTGNGETLQPGAYQTTLRLKLEYY